MNRIAMLRKKGLSQISLSLKLNVSQKMISAYENGKSEPSIATLMQMADIFNTSVDYIIGYTNIRQPIDKTVQMSLNEDECDLLGGYRELSAKQQNIALEVILGLLNSEKIKVISAVFADMTCFFKYEELLLQFQSKLKVIRRRKLW